MADNELTNRNNKGVFIEEHDYSLFNVTQFYNQVNLVIGCSKTGVINTPVMVISPENFEEIYGKRDYSLERKGSYFHRTVMNMLEAGPVLCLNIRNTNRDLDTYNFVNISTSSDIHNTPIRTAPIEDFYNISDGFWKRSTEDLLKVAQNSVVDAKKKPITVVNQKDHAVSLLFYKSDIRGFDVTAEEWFGGNVPSFIHQKDLISDYIINVLAVEGKWNDYATLSVHPKWSKYFNKTGIRVEQIESFIQQQEVTLVKKWTGSTIPYFKDKIGKDMYIQSVVNDDVNETGILLAYDSEVVETEFRSGLLDITGDNITTNPQAQLDFLSYKRNLTDFYLLEEKGLDQPNNAFGNPVSEIGNRTQLFSEGYVNGAKFKKLHINDTQSSVHIRPFDCDSDDDSYVIMNGKKIPLSNDITFIVDFETILSADKHIAFVVYVDSEGVKYKVSEQTEHSNTIILPEIKANDEMVLAYYRIWKNSKNYQYGTEVFGVAMDTEGFINPFNRDNIYTVQSEQQNIQKIVFSKTYSPKNQDYTSLRNYHMWYWLSKNIKEKESLILDILNQKQLIDRVSISNDTNNRYITITAVDKSCNITDAIISIYMTDLEFIPQNEYKWREKIQLYVENEDGIIGEDSLIYDSFVSGKINSGDPFFRSLSVEEDVQFLFSGGENYIILKEVQLDYDNINKILVFGTKNNDGLYNIVGLDYINGNYCLKVNERVSDESVDKIQLFDGEQAKIVNLYFINGKMQAKVEDYHGDLETLYRKVFIKENTSQWNKTIEIEYILAPNKILVSAKYSKHIKEGLYLLGNEDTIEGNKKRNWTRIVDSVRWADDESLLVVETDSTIRVKSIDGDLQTNLFLPIDKWVDSLDFKVLEGHVVRKESLPDGTEKRQNEILDLLSNTKLAKALSTDRIAWRYLVDSFGLGLVSNSKHQLAQLCSNKNMALGFLNVPSIKSFRKNISTSYVKNGVFDTKLLLSGGERNNSNSVRYSLTDVGKSHVMYITPYVTVKDLGRKFDVPPASYVAQLYMKKHNIESIKAWDIIAGTQYKISNIAGLEHIFDSEQLVDLDIMRMTPITSFQDYIYYMHTENTAEGTNSVLGYSHNREALIELEYNLKAELESHQWNTFTDINVENIIESADSICEQFKKSGAISDYENEFYIDDELIDAQIAVINTYVELVQGMGKILLRINIMKTNTIKGGL